MMKYRVWNKNKKKIVENKNLWMDQNGMLALFEKGSITPLSPEIYIVQRYTEQIDMYEKELFEGDLIRSEACGLIMEIKYGEYESYCPEDKSECRAVGFYAAAEGCADMPIGPTEEYAVYVGSANE